MALLQAHDPLPGLRVVDPAFDWAQIQLQMREGVQLSPCCPLVVMRAWCGFPRTAAARLSGYGCNSKAPIVIGLALIPIAPRCLPPIG